MQTESYRNNVEEWEDQWEDGERKAKEKINDGLINAMISRLSLDLFSALPYSRYHDKQPYHTSMLSGKAWLAELLVGHPECIHTELRVYLLFIQLLCNAGYRDLTNISIDKYFCMALSLVYQHNI